VFLDSLSTLFNNDHGFMLGALQCLRVSKSLRDQIGNALADGRPKVCDRLLYNDDEGEVHSLNLCD